MRGKHCRFGGGLAAGTIIYGLALGGVFWGCTRGEPQRPFGRFTAAQIVARSEPIRRRFAARLGTERDAPCTADPHLLAHRDLTAQRLWAVDCTNAPGDIDEGPTRSGVFLHWEADTGLLRLLSNAAPRQSATGTALDEAQVVRAGREWLRQLPVGGGGAWVLSKRPARPTRQSRHWRLHWRGAGRRVAVMQLEPTCGDLVRLRAHPSLRR